MKDSVFSEDSEDRKKINHIKSAIGKEFYQKRVEPHIGIQAFVEMLAQSASVIISEENFDGLLQTIKELYLYSVNQLKDENTLKDLKKIKLKWDQDERK